MSKERAVKQAVVIIELEDNVGAVLEKRKIMIPVTDIASFHGLIAELEAKKL